MNLNSSTNWALLGKGMLTEDELRAIHEASLEILEKTGIKYEEQDARDYYRAAGAEVDDETDIVKIPKWLTKACLASVPDSWVYCGRDKEHDYPLEYGRVGLVPFGIAPSIKDVRTGKIRQPLIQDVYEYARIVDQLDNMPVAWECLQPTDCSMETSGLHSLKQTLAGTRKPTLCASPNRAHARAAIAIAAAAVGGIDKLRERPLIMAGSCPKCPLFASDAVTGSVIEYALAGLPVMGMPMALAGATGPVTMAGTLVQQNCEILGNLCLSQIVRKGTPFLYGTCTSAMDLRGAKCVTGSAEHAMFASASARMAHFYHVPCVVPGTWTDSKCLDLQAGMEQASSALLPALAGANLVFGAGGIAGGLIADFSALVVEDDLFQEIQFILKGIRVDTETLAVNLIKECGAGGEGYLYEEHTATYMRDQQNWSWLFDRNSESEWRAEGARPIDEVARLRVLEMIETKNPSPLSDSVIEEMDAVIQEYEAELGISK